MGKGRAPCCDKSKVRIGPWSPAEDLRLINFIRKHGHSNWRALPRQAGLLRCGKSCRLRWINYLRPDLKRGNFTPEEEQTIIDLHNSIGNKWSKIASYFPGRTDNEIKNVWNTHLKKRLQTGKSTSIDNCNKIEAKHSKMDYSSSSSCISSSITSRDQDQPKDNEPKETTAFDSPSSSSVSSFSNRPNQALEYPKPDTNNPQYNLDNENIVIPSDFDIDFWELLESLDPLFQPTRTEHDGTGLNQDASVPVKNISVDSQEFEYTKSLRYLEEELGLTSDGDHEPKDQELMNLDQEIITNAWDYSPSFPRYLGI